MAGYGAVFVVLGLVGEAVTGLWFHDYLSLRPQRRRAKRAHTTRVAEPIKIVLGRVGFVVGVAMIVVGVALRA